MLHTISCAVAAHLLPNIIASNYNEPHWKVFVFFFLITYFVPVLGLIGLILAIPIVLYHSRLDKKTRNPINLTNIRNISTSKPEKNKNYHTLDLYNKYKSKDSNQRLQAIYNSLKLKDQDAIPLLRMALGDQVDEIRLLSYALLDRKESIINKRINNNKKKFDKIENSKNKELCQQIASDYWELAYIGLVQGETQNYVLNTARKYIEYGLKYYPNDPGLCFLLAQILLQLKCFQQALEQFKKAENLGIDYKKLLPYYAEIAFNNKEYSKFKQLMSNIDLHATSPKVSALAQFWHQENQ
ncbi:MAG: YybS family protein [Flavobacteriaceae bacterium]|nr:YybS family protein [Flavobacteriaceae bacterium]